MQIRCILARPSSWSPQPTGRYSPLLPLDLFTSCEVQLRRHCALGAECGSAATSVTLSRDSHGSGADVAQSPLVPVCLPVAVVASTDVKKEEKKRSKETSRILEKSLWGLICFIPSEREKSLCHGRPAVSGASHQRICHSTTFPKWNAETVTMLPSLGAVQTYFHHSQILTA